VQELKDTMLEERRRKLSRQQEYRTHIDHQIMLK
jgi:hypothetical protein